MKAFSVVKRIMVGLFRNIAGFCAGGMPFLLICNAALADTATAVSGTQINLSFLAGPAYSTIDVMRGSTPYNITTIASLPSSTTSYSNTGLQPGTTYYYRIHYWWWGECCIEGYYGSLMSATTWSAPSAPTSLNTSLVLATQFNLTWVDTSNNETSFQIERKTGTGGTYAQIATTAVNIASYDDASVAAGKTYYYRVRAANSVGNSVYSNEAAALPALPNAPSGLSGTASGETQINVTWVDNADNETGYKIERKQGAGGSYTQIDVTAANVSSYSDSTVSVGNTYYYRVRATNDAGDSAYSGEAQVAVTMPSQQSLYFVHVDHLNTPRLVADATGTTIWRWDQAEPFGNNPADENPSSLGVFDLPLRLPGQRYDKETGLHYNYFRDYDPSIGRYGESDPIGLRGGLNTYAYVGGQPLTYVDPSGEQRRLWPRVNPRHMEELQRNLPDHLITEGAKTATTPEGFGEAVGKYICKATGGRIRSSYDSCTLEGCNLFLQGASANSEVFVDCIKGCRNEIRKCNPNCPP